MTKKRSLPHKKSHIGVYASVVAAIIGLLFGLLVLLVSNPSTAFAGFGALLTGAVKNGVTGIGSVIYYTTIYSLCALSVGFASRTGVFNIGGAGQFILGGAAAAYVGVTWTFLPAGLHFLVALVVGAIVGALWGALIGLLKAFFNISEIVIGILLNYIGVYLTCMFVMAKFYDQTMNRSMPIPVSAQVPRIGMDKLLPGSAADAGIFIAIILAIVVWFVLERTTFGYEITACGFNQEASRYAGVASKRNIIIAMAIAGAISGIAGVLFYLSPGGNYIPISDATPAQPMTGICAALLAFNHPFGILVASLFISYITVGGFNMQVFGFVPEIVDIVTSAIIYCSAFVILISKGIDSVRQAIAERRLTK